MEQRMAKLEQKLDDHIRENKESSSRNDLTHARLEEKLDRALLFQMKLRWVVGTTALIFGAGIGWVSNNAYEIWAFLTRHGH